MACEEKVKGLLSYMLTIEGEGDSRFYMLYIFILLAVGGMITGNMPFIIPAD